MPYTSKKQQVFSLILLKWNREKNTRQMPWKGEKDPYKIWLSEIILQQTRVEQGLSYYNNFIRIFPDVHKLANAPEEKVFKLWEGLGYYSRCRNLITSAKYISRELKGKFPDAYENIKALKGVGPYTAAAISSFAFNLPYAVVDGNVFRVLARIFGVSTPIDSTEGKKEFISLADQLLDEKKAGLYNQAIMDFGALVCKPAPLCNHCPFKKNCFAFRHKRIHELPVRAKKTNITKRWFYYFVIRSGAKTAIQQRTDKDIWQYLYEFPMIELDKQQELKAVLSEAEKKGLLKNKNYTVVKTSEVYKQQLSHQLIAGQFIEVTLKKNPGKRSDWAWLTMNEVRNYAFPRMIIAYLENLI